MKKYKSNELRDFLGVYIIDSDHFDSLLVYLEPSNLPNGKFVVIKINNKGKGRKDKLEILFDSSV